MVQFWLENKLIHSKKIVFDLMEFNNAMYTNNHEKQQCQIYMILFTSSLNGYNSAQRVYPLL